MNFTNTHPDVNIRAKYTKPTGYNSRSEDLRTFSPVI